MSKTIFISYSTKDAEGAEEICRLLEERGISCWIAPRDVPPGADWAESIMEGIKQAQGFVLVLSEHVNTSRHCKSEVEVAFSAGKAVFPVRLRRIEPSQSLHLFLASSQWIDAFDPPLEAHMDRLAAAIKSLTDTSATPAAAPSSPPTSRVVPRTAPKSPAKSKTKLYGIAAAAVLVFAIGGWALLGGGSPSGGPADSGASGNGANRTASRRGEPQLGDEKIFDGIEFVWIPAGTFQRGSPPGEQSRGRDEQQHEVILTKGFWMAKYELKKEQWAAVMETKPWQGKDNIPYAENGPASLMTWVDANLFARKLNKEQDGPYRLPTEAEWEYACRAGTTTPYSFGVHEGFQLQEHAWFVVNCYQAKEPYAHAVGTRKPNPWGLYDMHGNLWEFCSDWHGAYPFPEDGALTDPKGPETGNLRVLRGGAYDSRDYQTRSALRYTIYMNRAYATVGIRLVRDHVTG